MGNSCSAPLKNVAPKTECKKTEIFFHVLI